MCMCRQSENFWCPEIACRPNMVKGEACLPYIKGITEPLQRFLHNNGIKAAARPYRTLQQEFNLLQTKFNVASTILFMAVPDKALTNCQTLSSGHLLIWVPYLWDAFNKKKETDSEHSKWLHSSETVYLNFSQFFSFFCLFPPRLF